MIVDHKGLSIVRQCRLLRLCRSAFYYRSRGENPLNLELLRLIDEKLLETPWYRRRQMTRHLRRLGHDVSNKREHRLMRRMGLSLVYQKPRTSLPPYPEQGLTASPAGACYRAAKPGLVRRHQLFPHAQELLLHGSDH
ncbi:IS3 family transposase [Desulfocurvibacter africanus]|uniref:IS3 family transposase n=1 Tax=Desulfocurvibacter africanus TaxID=873 RepID=UPI003A4E63BB